MRKLITILLFIFVSSSMAGAGTIKPGVTITKDNLEQYLSQLEKLLIPSYHNHAIPAIKNGWITMPVVVGPPIVPPPGYAKFTKENAGKARIGEGNRLLNWKGGMPFPDPKTGAELAWNAYRKRNVLEELEFYADYRLVDKEGNTERRFTWTLFKKQYVGRTDIPPIPEMPGNDGKLESKESLIIHKPFDARGFSMIRTRFEDTMKEDKTYAYIPAIRRVRRMSGSDLTDPLLGSDCIPDDFEGWRQKLDDKMTFKMLGTRDFLVPCDYDSLEKLPKPFFVKGRLQCDWEIRPLWMLEVLPNNPDYAYSKRMIYLDSTSGTCALYACDNYDEKGRFYRSNFWNVQSHDPKTLSRGWWGSTYKNIITNHTTTASIIANWDVWYHPNTAEMFSFKQLIRKAR